MYEAWNKRKGCILQSVNYNLFRSNCMKEADNQIFVKIHFPFSGKDSAAWLGLT